MIDSEHARSRVREQFPFLVDAAEGFDACFFPEVSLVSLPAGQSIGEQGSTCAALPLVVSGVVRVYRLGENGREVTLYRIHAGESCILSASCLLQQSAGFPAFAVCETDVEAVIVPKGRVLDWLREQVFWRDFVYGLVSQRLVEVIELLDAVLFQRLNVRLASFLLDRADGSDAGVQITHQGLARELGSSREVMSRLLHSMEERGLVRVERGRIDVLDPVELAEMAGES
jgi:CRP/FNR family transcriptional regulator